MTVISSLKEAFAFAPIPDRQKINEKFANKQDVRYFQGLVLLQKLYDEAVKQKDPLVIREPSEVEVDLIKKMSELLEKYDKNAAEYQELNTRFHLLTYPFNSSQSTEFIKKAFNLDLSKKQDTLNDAKLPSKLDPQLIDSIKVLKDSLKEDYVEIKPAGIPAFISLLEKDSLSEGELVALLNKLFQRHPTDQYPVVLDRLVKFWKNQHQNQNDAWNLEWLTFSELTLKQLDYLMETIPDVVCKKSSFIETYLSKLVPYTNYTHSDSIWDDDQDYLLNYLNQAELFIERLPPYYSLLQTAVKFHKLRIDITRQTFDENKLIEYLALKSGKLNEISSFAPSTYSFAQYAVPEANTSIPHTLPIFGSCYIQGSSHFEVLNEYIYGLAMQGKLTATVESLSVYENPKMLWSIFARAKPTEKLDKTFISETLMKIAPSSIHRSLKRKPQDTIVLTLQTKNLSRLAIRVFQMHTTNYWRLHPNSSQDIQLDGLCPTWEEDVDLVNDPIKIIQHDFAFGEAGLAPTVFAGRGIWVIEFVGDNNQCRAIIQKGYLRHITQKTIAGHLVKIIDEEGNPVEASKVLYENQYYEADESNNILIPYLPSGSSPKSSQMLLVSSKDGFCEPVTFTQEVELYQLEATFHVNHEMISFNKKATVVVLPKLTLNGQPFSAIESATLKVECTNTHDITATTTTAVSLFNEPILFDFIVPELLETLEFKLEAKVKALNGSIETVSASHCNRYTIHDGQPTNVCLKRGIDGQYFIHVLGQNGEPKPGKEIWLVLKHAYVSSEIRTSLQSNDEGIIELGQLPNIISVEYKGQTWNIAPEYSTPLLPSFICVEANKPFKVANDVCSIYKMGYENVLSENVSESIQKENGLVTISGLSKGEYKIFLGSHNQYFIKCTVVESMNKPMDKLWTNWVIGQDQCIQQNGAVVQDPLQIVSTHCDEDKVVINLKNWSSKTFAVVTANAFVPTLHRSLFTRIFDSRHLSVPESQENMLTNTRSIFLQDKKIGEEHQYIMNRARSEKWAGSNLTHPSLLIHPKRVSLTVSEFRNLKTESAVANSRAMGYSAFGSAPANQYKSMMMCARSNRDESIEPNFGFLNHVSRILVVPVDSISGTIVVDRKLLGHQGTLLECAVISGEQTIYKEILMNPDTPLVYHDLRQHENQALVRSKAVRSILPNDSVELDAREHEVIDTVEKLFTTISLISSAGAEFSNDFEFLKRWSSIDEKEKVKIYSEMACHELNLWIKRKDPVFFEKAVQPAIKSKIRKSFMDLYLLEEDLSMYSQDMYAFEQLNTAEKALLAKTQSQEFLDAVLNKFKDSMGESQQSERESDDIFDAIFAGISFKDEDEDMGFMMPTTPEYVPVQETVAAAHEVMSDFRMMERDLPPPQQQQQQQQQVQQQRLQRLQQLHQQQQQQLSPPTVQEEDPEIEEAKEKLRERAIEKQKQKKAKYEFIKPSTEWVETEYYRKEDSLKVSQFWVDYLECKDVFLSPNFIYHLDHVTDMLWVMCLMDLPFTNEWTKEYNEMNKQITIKTGASSPVIVFHRQLNKVTGSEVSLESLVICQELFVDDGSVSVTSDECIKIDPSTTSLEPQTNYGCQLVVSNLSSATVRCEVTYQIPTGAIPVGHTSYRLSKSILIEPYSTWREVTGTFYFPQAGHFSTVPTTATVEKQGKRQLTKTAAASLSVVDRSQIKEEGAVTALYWPSTASHGSNAEVLSFLSTYRRLDKLDFSLIYWRMIDSNFARQVFDLLSRQRCFFSEALWKYGIYHQFTDIIKDLLQFNHQALLDRVGGYFKSPLVSTQEPTDVYDYFPVVNARAHPLQPEKKEILNQQFYAKYDAFLSYLCQRPTAPSVSDRVIQTQYLILQNRLGEAQEVFSHIHLDEAQENHSIQIDYLHAYLKTRVRITDQDQWTQLDLAPIKAILKKYESLSLQKWRKRFDELREFVQELERGTSGPSSARSIQSQALLEFTVDPASHALVLEHANVRSVQICYYEMNIEVMFSLNPFMNNTVHHDTFKLFKPSWVETVDLEDEPVRENEADAEDFDMIGLGQVQSIRTTRIPFQGHHKHMLIEVAATSLTPHAILPSRPLERSCAYYANSLRVHVAESFGVVRVLAEKTKRPVVGAYVKVYARLKQGKKVEFWKDGYTGLNGVFDYVSVTEGNALAGVYDNDLKRLIDQKIDKLSLLILSQEGAVVKEVYPPLA